MIAAVFIAGVLLGVLLTCLAWCWCDRACVRRPGYLPVGEKRG